MTNLARELTGILGADSVHTFVMGSQGSYDVAGTVHVDVPNDPLRRRMAGGRALAMALDRCPVDVVVAPGTEISVVRQVPTVMWPLTVAPFEAPAMDQLGASLQQRGRWLTLRRAVSSAARRADGLVFSSHYARALHLAAIPQLRGTPSTVIPPAPSLRPVDAHTSVPQRSLPRPYLLFVSHLYPYKMVVEMVQGYALARKEGVQLDLVIVGAPVNAGYAHRVDEVIERLGLRGCVHLLGGVGQDTLPGLYRNADAFLFPSISENAGSFALIDAFVFGVPVIASSMSSMPEACQDAVRYFDPRSPEQLAEEIVRVVGSRGLRADLARRSARRGAEYGDWATIASSLVSFLESVVRRSG